MLNDIFKAVGPIVAAALAEKAGRFEGGKFQFEDGDFRWDSESRGVALEELDLTGEVPTRVSVAGGTRVRIAEGDVLRIKASGPGSESLRFLLRDGQLSVLPPRRDGADVGEPELDIAMPAPRALSVGGSGQIETDTLAGKARLAVAGSGRITVRAADCENLKASIAGSGILEAGGRAAALKLSVAGSGIVRMEDLDAERAKISIAGSGRAAIGSDGEVDARMMGSGDVTIHGSARCSVRSMGSGRLQIIPRGRDAPDAPEAPVAPKPPKPPKPSKPPKKSKARKARRGGRDAAEADA